MEQAFALPVRVNTIDFGFTEGPTNDRDCNIYFSDLKANRIHHYDTRTNEFSVWAEHTKGSNGACFLLDGSLVSCRGSACDVVRWTADGRVDQVLAGAYEGTPFNAPNDLVIARSGWIYFTDPDFDLRGHHPDAVYSISPQGEVIRFEERILRPNGIVLSPDESMLFVDGTKQRDIVAYDIRANGKLINRQVYASVRDPNRDAYPGYPTEAWFGCDGMAIDEEWNLYVTCGAGIEVFDRDRNSVGVITTPEKPCNVCFGGPDRKTLFITAQTSLYKVPVNTSGLIFQQC